MGVTHEKIVAIVAMFRSWDPQDPRLTVQEISRRFDLDVTVILRLAESEEIVLLNEPGTPVPVDEDAVTEPLYIGDRRPPPMAKRAHERPYDPDDEITLVWRRSA